MNKFIQLSSDERSLYCRQAAERMATPLPAAVIEKDFWEIYQKNKNLFYREFKDKDSYRVERITDKNERNDRIDRIT